MGKVVLTVILAMLIATGIAWDVEATVLQTDGTDWEGKTDAERVFWVEGFLSGVAVVLINYRSEYFSLQDYLLLVGEAWEMFMREAEGTLYSVPAEDRRGVKSTWRFSLAMTLLGVKERVWEDATERLELFGVTVGQLKEGMDKLYQDYRNRGIALVDAVYIANMEVRGSRPELIDAQVRYLRMQPTPRICKTQIDWTRGRAAQEEALRGGWFADPVKEDPTKKEDYSITPLFRYGEYE